MSAFVLAGALMGAAHDVWDDHGNCLNETSLTAVCALCEVQALIAAGAELPLTPSASVASVFPAPPEHASTVEPRNERAGNPSAPRAPPALA